MNLQKLLVGMVTLLAASVAFAEPPMDIPRISGNLQFLTYYTQDTSEVQFQMGLRRARLIFSGVVIPRKVGYFVQWEGAGTAKLLDAKLVFWPFRNAQLVIGRFMPKFTYYMPHSSKSLDFVEYPLLSQYYGMWRQLGFQFSFGKHGFYRIHTGLFTGYPKNNWSDLNSAKSLLLSMCAHPIVGLDLLGYSWFENAIGKGENDLSANRYGVAAQYETPLSSTIKLRLGGEFALGVDEQENGTEIKSHGFYFQGGMVVNEKLEVLARFDQFDPNIDEDNDGKAKMILGFNYHLLGDDVVIYLNFIHNEDQVPSGVKEPEDDEVVLQIQVGF